jgi:protein-arginine kinase activator protein McsA
MPTKMTTQIFVNKSLERHGDRYDYTLTQYVKSNTKVTILCHLHGPFNQRPNDHLTGNGCPECGQLLRQQNRKISWADMLNRFHQIHGDKYDYTNVSYKDISTHITIACKIHGEFTQIPNNHLQGLGCYRCGREVSGNKKRGTFESFVASAVLVHSTKYDYTNVDYKTSSHKVSIVCDKHGAFEQTPNNHLQGYGCPSCGHRISQPEIDWLTYHQIPLTDAHRQVVIWCGDTRYVVDGYLPETNTAYEFDGDFWHGNPTYYIPTDINVRAGKTYGELYEATLRKREALQKHGYNVVHIWESDWAAIKTKAPSNEL